MCGLISEKERTVKTWRLGDFSASRLPCIPRENANGAPYLHLLFLGGVPGTGEFGHVPSRISRARSEVDISFLLHDLQVNLILPGKHAKSVGNWSSLPPQQYFFKRICSRMSHLLRTSVYENPTYALARPSACTPADHPRSRTRKRPTQRCSLLKPKPNPSPH